MSHKISWWDVDRGIHATARISDEDWERMQVDPELNEKMRKPPVLLFGTDEEWEAYLPTYLKEVWRMETPPRADSKQAEPETCPRNSRNSETPETPKLNFGLAKSDPAAPLCNIPL